MTPEKLLEKLRKQEISQYKGEDGSTIRFNGGQYQILCLTCPGEKWNNIHPAFAKTWVKRLLK
jgi:hypothetical protein